jgi:isopentenyl-diphosphate delta-isomerase
MKVILVDENDKEIGTEFKIKAHREGRLHRAFSIFVFNSKGELLLQKRSAEKYHSGGLWSNTCCSHPRPGEKTLVAAHRRLKEEMGFDCGLKEVSTLRYKVEFENELTEYEFDHIFTGKYDGEININKSEVEEFKWIDPKILIMDIKKNPKNYTYWFLECCDKFKPLPIVSIER